MIPGVRIGHHTMSERPTGCTVVLFDGGAVGGVDVRGSAPGTRETDLLNPGNLVDRVNAIVLSGGSAFGLEVASGVMRFLEERGEGFVVREEPRTIVPIVPQAILFDLFVGDDPSVRPDAACGYAAATAATGDNVAEGSVGAGAGATVGKLRGLQHAMKGGIGIASLTLANGLTVTAIVAVNALGDVIDPATGRVVAGVRDDDGSLMDARLVLRGGATIRSGIGENTTIGVVVTNAALTKVQVTKLAQSAHDGLARAIYPIHTMYDGDAMFAAATGSFEGEISMLTLETLVADVVARAVIRGVREASGLPNLPSASDLQP